MIREYLSKNLKELGVLFLVGVTFAIARPLNEYFVREGDCENYSSLIEATEDFQRTEIERDLIRSSYDYEENRERLNSRVDLAIENLRQCDN